MSLPYFAKSLSWWLRFFVLPLHRISKNPSISHLLLPAVLSLSTCLPHGFGCLPAVLSSATLGPLRLRRQLVYTLLGGVFSRRGTRKSVEQGASYSERVYTLSEWLQGVRIVEALTSSIRSDDIRHLPQPQRALGSKETAPYLLTYFSLQAVRRYVHRKYYGSCKI